MGESLQPNFIAGEWVSSADAVDVLDPAIDEVIARVSLVGSKELDRAINAAEQVHRSGALTRVRPSIRRDMLWRVGDALAFLKPSGAILLSRESGKRLIDAEAEFDEAIAYFRYYSGLADKIEGSSIPLGAEYHDYTVRIPYGVTAHIVPWNFPLAITARSLAPALAAGNTAVVKLSELAPLTGLLLGKACEIAAIPKGAVSILCGDGATIGNALVQHDAIQQVVFTGSVRVGQQILERLAQRVVPAVTELGGKSAAIVAPDADLDQVRQNVYSGAFLNAGQVCSAMSRLIVPRALQDQLSAMIAQDISKLSIGPGIKNNDVTPVISQQHADRILTAVADAKDEGATLVAGGHRLNRIGNFVAPTLFKDVTRDMTLAQNEVFGPVLAILPYDSLQEALAIANCTKFGLAAGIFTRSLNLAHSLASQLEAGQIYVNEWYAGGIETPFGGMKLSGNGRDKGQDAILNYLQTKNIGIRLNDLE